MFVINIFLLITYILMDNFYFIDKPLGISSFDIIRKLRRKLNVKKMWHTWTLDPLATWGMVIAVWSYTKLIPYLEKASKTYEFNVMLNWTSDSLDLWEEVEFISQERQKELEWSITLENIQKIISQKFLWKTTQVPPKYSALKIDWKRAYELAREWIDVKMKEREIEIFEHEILSYNYPELKLKAKVSAGTYIRTIAADLAIELWTVWYVSELRRIKIWWLDITNSTELDEVEISNFTPVDRILDKKYFLENFDEEHVRRLNHWLDRFWKFSLELDIPYFIYNWEKITNIVKYDGKKLMPIKKVC